MWLYILISALVSASLTYLICYHLPQQKVREKNLSLEIEEQQTKNKIQELYNEKNLRAAEIENLEKQKALVARSINEAETYSQNLRSQAENNANTYYNDLIEKLKYRLQMEEQNLQKKYENYEAEYEAEYSQLLTDFVSAFKEKDAELTAESENLKSAVKELRAKADAIVEVNKRSELNKSQKDFYRIQLSEEDKEEIEKLRTVLPYLRDKEPLNKVIYKVYYEKPLLMMIGRVLGQNKKCGIYKITNLLDGKCYVGQSNNVQQRWVQHVRRGVGADTPTNNKLYPILNSIGVENFMFELIEECDPTQLNEREKYYQEVFHAQDYGYSIK